MSQSCGEGSGGMVKMLAAYNNVSFSDACTAGNKGIIFNTNCLDAGRHIRDAQTTLHLVNESESTWGYHREVMISNYGCVYKNSDRREISDGDKGNSAAWERHMSDSGAINFLDSTHRADNLSKKRTQEPNNR